MKAYFLVPKTDAWRIAITCEYHNMPLETKMLKKESSYCYIKMSDYEFDLCFIRTNEFVSELAPC